VKTALVIATYNRSDALAAVLEGYLHQSTTAFEVFVADDGSKDDVRVVTEAYAKRAPFPITHLWHEDKGFRAATMRNRALAATRADYVIYTDGDCVPRHDFVEQHQRFAEPGFFLSGNRILLSEAFTAQALQTQWPLYGTSPTQWLMAWLRRDINRLLPLVRLPEGAFRKRSADKWQGVKTCNFSAWRKDLIAVNGFDEAYAGKWGLEDSDLAIRLIHAGVKHKNARFAAAVFHLWHREADKRGFDDNQRLLDELLASKRSRARIGIDQYPHQ
jgi:glycosyltransferase involved in cell wall biosynthesis